MKKTIGGLILLFLIAVPNTPAAENQPVRFADIQPELETNTAALSDNIGLLGAIAKSPVEL